MKRVYSITVLKSVFFSLASLCFSTNIQAQSQVPVDKASTTPTTQSPGLVFAWPDWAVQNFQFDNEYINHYGFGFHSFDDGTTTVDGINAYTSSYFGIDMFTGGQRRFRINSNGNVGIGGVPQKRLDIGNFRNGSTSNEVVLRLRNTVAGNLSSGWGSAIEFFNESNNIESISSQNEGGAKIISEASDFGWAHNLKFRVVSNNSYSSQTGIDALVINNSGNIGVGTANTPDRLNVNGKIRCEEIQVVVDVADYVFENDYELMPLEKVEAYIQENKHLPGVPGKAEVNAEGFQVGKMTNKVLEKVEELTLYLIELKKENEVLKQNNQELLSRIEKLEKSN
jgi:hypothetical protein